jgi:hypothetical protein
VLGLESNSRDQKDEARMLTVKLDVETEEKMKRKIRKRKRFKRIIQV